MRHRKRSGRLNRTAAERRALLRGLVCALLQRQRITTTLAKAREARRLADKVITLGKYGDLSSIRRAFAILQDRSLVKELVSEIAPRFKNRQGGYTRIIRLSGRRKGDNAPLVLLELTEQRIAPSTKKAKKEKKAEDRQQLPEKTPEAAPPKEEKKTPREERRPHRDEKRLPIEKGKKGFFQNLKRFLKPKTGT